MANLETGQLSVSMTTELPSDVVMSLDGSILYVAGVDGKIRLYDVASRSLMATWDVGVSLGGMDLSPDGSFLIVTERQEVSSNGQSSWNRVATVTTYKVATETGAVTGFPVQIYAHDGPFYDVAVLADGSVLLTASMVGATGSAPLLWRLDSTTGNYTHLQNPYIQEDTMLWASPSGSHALIAPQNISDGALYLYEPGAGVTAQGNLYEDGYLQTVLSVQAISVEAGLVVQSAGKLIVRGLDLDLDLVLSDLHTAFRDFEITGLAFDGSGANLYILDEVSDTVTQLSTADWSIVRTFAVGREVANPAETFFDGDFGNQLLVSSDGRFLTVVTGTGIQVIEDDSLDNSFTGTDGDDVLAAGAGWDLLHGRDGDDDLDGGTGNDSLYGAEGNDIVRGGAGNDSLYVWGLGTDRVEGGAGDRDNLILVYGDATGPITMTQPAVDPNGGFTGSITGEGRSVTYSGIEIFSLTTGSGNDILWGGGNYAASPNTRNFYNLGGGDDLFYGMGGTDTVDAGDGLDGFSGTMNSGGVYWSLQPTPLGGIHNFYTNFEYFLSLTTSISQDIIVTANVDRNDSITLGGGSDSVTLYNGHDTVNGGPSGAGSTIDSGLDTLVLNYGQSTSAVRNVGTLTSTGTGYSGQFTDDGTRLATFEAIDRFLIATGSAADSIVTGNGNDQIRTAGGNDVVSSGGGNDLIDGGSGDDMMTGGLGSDSYVVDSAGDVVVEAAGEGVDEIRTALATYSLAGLANVENLSATSDAAHDFRGNSGDNVVTGGAGADVLRMHDGGDDVVMAGAGNDNIFFIGSLTAADVVNGGEGGDTLVLQGPYGSLSLTANVTGIEHISILAGSNTVFGGSSTDRYDYVLTIHDSNFAAGVQARINGAALLAGEDFTFDGSAETDALFVVYGGKGKDTLTGGLGNDIFFYAEERFANGDTVNGGSGYDGMFLRGNYTIDFTAAGYTGLFTSIENLTLTSATDERYARGGGTEFDYNLTLSDAIVGAGQTLTVSGALLQASETMVFDASQESDGALRLFGGKASDTLKGGALDDLIHGGLGADMLAGNGGADVFRYQNVAESTSGSMDHILDFTPGPDKIDLSRIDANSLVAGNQAFSWTESFSGTAGELMRDHQGGTDWLILGDTDGDSVADLVILITAPPTVPIWSNDFIL